MGRFVAMSASEESNEPPPRPEAVVTGDLLPARPVDPCGGAPVPADTARYERVRHLRMRVPDSSLARAAVETAARLWCLTEPGAVSVDLCRTGHVARYLYVEAVIHQAVDYRRAFRRSNVDRYLDEYAQRHRPRTVRQVRDVLFKIGRILHPREYPQRQQVPAPRSKRQTPATSEEIRIWYGMSSGLPHPTSERLLIALDLTLGAGARAADLRTTRGADVDAIEHDGHRYAVVRLANNAGGYRHVPVLSEEIGDRLLSVAEARGDRILMRPNAIAGERNTANRINERLSERGFPTINLARLRNSWILRTADQIPARQVLQLADLLDMRVLTDNWHGRDEYSIADIIASHRQVRL